MVRKNNISIIFVKKLYYNNSKIMHICLYLFFIYFCIKILFSIIYSIIFY